MRERETKGPASGADLGRESREPARGRKERALTRSQERTLGDVSAFRIVDLRDLADRRGDLESLRRRGLVKVHSLPTESGVLKVAVSTERGRRLLREASPDAGARTFYAGLVKVREAEHDTGVYRMFRAYEDRIRRSGGRVRRVVLDHELKRRLFSRLNRGVPQERAAAEVGLKVVGGKVPLPDLRIEYETASGRTGRVDLELATSHYKPEQRAEKRAAGFAVHMSEDFASEAGTRRDRLAAEAFTL